MYHNKSLIYKAPKSNFTIVPKEIILDTQISDGAKLLAIYLIGLPNEWNISWANIAKTLKKSLSTIERYKTELIKKGFLFFKQEKNSKGQFEANIKYQFKSFKEYLKQSDEKDILQTYTQQESNNNENVKIANNEKQKETIFTMSKTESPNLVDNNNIYSNNNKEVIIWQKSNLNKSFFVFNNTQSDSNNKTNSTYNTTILNSLNINTKLTTPIKHKKDRYNLYSFLTDDKEINKALEWIQYRRENYNIPAKCTVKKLRIAKEKGWDIIASIERSLINDYRGLFEAKRTYTNTNIAPKGKNQNLSDLRLISREIEKHLLKTDWNIGDSLENYLINGKKIKLERGLFQYV